MIPGMISYLRYDMIPKVYYGCVFPSRMISYDNLKLNICWRGLLKRKNLNAINPSIIRIKLYADYVHAYILVCVTLVSFPELRVSLHIVDFRGDAPTRFSISVDTNPGNLCK